MTDNDEPEEDPFCDQPLTHGKPDCPVCRGDGVIHSYRETLKPCPSCFPPIPITDDFPF
jgi:hypothetical protein